MSMLYCMPMYVGIILQEKDRVFLKKRGMVEWAPHSWNFPGGKVEAGETLAQAALREAQEEVGVSIKPEDIALVHVLHVHKSASKSQDLLGVYFAAEKWEGIPRNNEPNKAVDAQWFSVDSLPQGITKHALLALTGLQKGIRYSESGW